MEIISGSKHLGR